FNQAEKGAHRAGNGSRAGGQPFSRGAFYALLSNPVFIGEIAKQGARYCVQQEPILDRQTWDSVQDQLRDGASEQRATGPRQDRSSSPHRSSCSASSNRSRTPQTEPPILKWRPHACARRNHAAGTIARPALAPL